MTTLTIDMPLKLKKTHFANPLEAGYFLIGLSLKHKSVQKKVSDSRKINSIDSYTNDLADMKQGKNISSLDEIRAIYS